MQIIPQPVEMTVLTHTPLQELLYNTSRYYITQEKIMCPIYPVNTSILRFLDLFLVFSFCLSLPFCLLLSFSLFVIFLQLTPKISRLKCVVAMGQK